MMQRVPWLVIAMTAGCELWKAPDRVHELEGRVDELSATLSAITGKAVGAGKKHGDKPADGHGDKPATAAADPHAEPVAAEPPKDVDAHEGPVELDIHPPPESRSTVAELAKKVGQDFPHGDQHAKPHWGYDGAVGADRWGALDPEWATCSKGKQQSPIDISPHVSTASAIEFHYKPTAGAIVDNGHTGQVNLTPGSSIEIDGHSYDLVQFHTHTPSEHTIAGERFPLEVHLVHKDAAGKLAVIGVLYDEGADSKALEPLWSRWPAKKDAEAKLKKPFDPATLLPTTRTVYRYTGSLTTPPCSEGVVWNVMRRPMSESKPHIQAIAGHYKNARTVQALFDRKVQ